MPSDNYSDNEVRAIAENYLSLNYYRHHLWILVRLADFEKGFASLTAKEKPAVFLHLMVGLSPERVGKALGCTEHAAESRSRRGMERLLARMNGRPL